MPIITVIATVRAKPGQEENLKKLLLELVDPTHREPGCINYDMHQSIEEKGSFCCHENWESKDAFERHMKSPHFVAFGEKAKGMIDGEPSIRRYAKIG